LNKAIQIANGDKLIFIDGDCILHEHFIKEYRKAIKPGIFCYGRRAMVSESFTKKLLHDKSIQRLNYFSVLFSGGEWMAAGIYIPWKINQHKQHRRILGCNWGICKDDILKVNGFDEDYTVAGVGEDFDIDWRLKKNGMKLFSMKNKAIVYHLYHKANHNEKDKQFVENMMHEKTKLGFYFCKNGIIKS
jgi:GT2 family glycosyltransferase